MNHGFLHVFFHPLTITNQLQSTKVSLMDQPNNLTTETKQTNSIISSYFQVAKRWQPLAGWVIQSSQRNNNRKTLRLYPGPRPYHALNMGKRKRWDSILVSFPGVRVCWLAARPCQKPVKNGTLALAESLDLSRMFLHLRAFVCK